MGVRSTTLAAGPPGPAAPERARSGDLPAGAVVRAFGVDYAHLHPAGGGDLYVTRFGWPHAAALDPACWYADEWYVKHGVRLPGSTGNVYRVRTRPVDGRALDLVVKFSRVAQDVPLMVASSFPDEVPPDVLAQARFNSPMEEFGLTMELRETAARSLHPGLIVQRPLAIYVPGEEFEQWELGRSSSAFHSHRCLLAEDQDTAVRAIELDIRRIYVLLYGWIKGRDAQECWEAGDLPEADFLALAPRVNRELAEAGFRVLDNKPRHFILRQRADGRLLARRDGGLVYGLVDFELLQRTAERQREYHTARRAAYWRLQGRPPAVAPPPVPSQLRRTSVFGVDYVFGHTPDGGQLWVVGERPELFDYFLPDRWRRTPRVKLSAGSEVYRTRTRDHVEVVYRRSRVGLRPRVDPLAAAGKRIREAGYNSPFEEVAIAERLRQMGISTTYPRAIYRTGHATLKSMRLRDTRRLAAHAAARTPEDVPAPALDLAYDYYTIWDTCFGPDPRSAGAAGGAIALERARDDGLLAADEATALAADARRRLERIGLPAEGVADDDLVVRLGPGGAVRREHGQAQVALSIDALTACEVGLLAEAEYLALIRRTDERLRAADFEKLDPNGRHLLLTMDPDGRFQREPSGEPHVTLCNFALVHGLYRPVR